MSSAFPVFDLIGGDAGFQCKGDSGGLVHAEFDDPEEAFGLVSGEES